MIPVNYVALLVATVAGMIIGALWYSPLLFVKEWMKLIGKNEKECKENMPPQQLLIVAVATFVAAYVLSFFMYYLGARDWMDGVKIGALAWLGFNAMLGWGEYTFAGWPTKLYVLNKAHQLVTLAVMGAVIAILS